MRPLDECRDENVSGRDATPVGKERELEALRELLLGAERRELETLRRKIDGRELSPDEVIRVLPDAILRRRPDDDRLAEALAPILEEGLERSVRRNPRPLTDAIFPIIGPAIRKSVRHSLHTLTESINQTLEQSLSLRGMGWRLEALRTGRPFADVVLKHSVQYRVEQVFLIHGESSLLIEHVTAPAAIARDADMVSSMFGAIQDFAAESFDEHGEGGIEQIEFGDLSIQVARGPLAVLACAVRGVAPATLRDELDSTLEAIHHERAAELADFDGDVQPLSSERPRLEALLQEKLLRPKGGGGRAGGALLAMAILIPIALAGAWMVRRWDSGKRWTQALSALRDEPGILVLRAEREAGRYRLAGLRDPLALDPSVLLAKHRLDHESVDAHWELYDSLEPEFVLERARGWLKPPQTVELTLAGDVLTAVGKAPHFWVEKFHRSAGQLPGVLGVDDEKLVDLGVERAFALAREFELISIPFAAGSDQLPDSSEVVEGLARRFVELEALFQSIDADLTLIATGFHVADEGELEGLAIERARSVTESLQRKSIGVSRFGFVLVGSESARSVSFRILGLPATAEGE